VEISECEAHVDVDIIDQIPSWWQEIDPVLREKGFATKYLIYQGYGSAVENYTKDACRAAILTCDDRAAPRDTRDFESAFYNAGIEIADLSISECEASSDFCVWLTPSYERQKSLSLTDIEELLTMAAEFLESSGWATIELRLKPERHGLHGLLLMRYATGARVEWDLGPQGWTAWGEHRWLYSSPGSLLGSREEEIGRSGSHRYLTSWEIATGAVVATNVFMPFMQAFAAKAGEDAYHTIRNAIIRYTHFRRRTRLHDFNGQFELAFNPPLPDEAIRQLARMKPGNLKGKVAEWDRDTKTWKISPRARKDDLCGALSWL
jgi:hypothetical protein